MLNQPEWYMRKYHPEVYQDSPTGTVTWDPDSIQFIEPGKSYLTPEEEQRIAAAQAAQAIADKGWLQKAGDWLSSIFGSGPAAPAMPTPGYTQPYLPATLPQGPIQPYRAPSTSLFDSPVFWIVAMSGAGIAAILILKRRKRNKGARHA